MKIDVENSEVLNKSKLVVRNNDYVDVIFLMTPFVKFLKTKRVNLFSWDRLKPQFIEANLMWQKVHPDLVVSQYWNDDETIYTVRTHYIEPRSNDNHLASVSRGREKEWKNWEDDVKLYLSLIDYMGFEKCKDDLSYWNIYHGIRNGKPVNYIIDWDELIELGSEENAYIFYKEELCRHKHSQVYFYDPINKDEVEERFDKLWKEKVG